jgi:Ni2+-binding GTPase involved in maturation of urease and hydrogenase
MKFGFRVGQSDSVDLLLPWSNSNMKLVLTGGFLGSGKTTAIANAARMLLRANRKVAVITNDQGDQQVDSAFIRKLDIPMKEVSNGCFCCNYPQLDEHIQALGENYPELIFAESVGSCTDLISTITKPLHNFKPEIEVVISIFADAELLSSILEGRSAFIEESVRYIYKKQLAEADLLILNKIDLLRADQQQMLDGIIRAEYPGKIILHQNSLLDDHIEGWLAAIHNFSLTGERISLDIDYKIYGQGEAELAWLDKSITIQVSDGEATFIVKNIIASIVDEIQLRRFAIGHLKFFVESQEGSERVSFTSTSTGADVKLNQMKSNLVTILINARVETAPKTLEEIVDEILAVAERRYGCKVIEGRWSVFRPGFPRPTHRILA